MPAWALACLASSTGGAKVRVSCSRADRPSSWVSLTWPPRWRPTSLPTPAYQNPAARSPARRRTQLEPLEDEGRGDGRPHQGVAAQGPGRLPDPRLDHGLRPLPRVDVRTEDQGVGPPVVPLAPELEGLAGVEVPEFRGVDAVPGRNLALEEQVVN